MNWLTLKTILRMIKASSLLSQLEKVYKVERKYLECRANRTESLAAVGLSVETASHDMMLMMGKGLTTTGINE